MSKAHDLNCLLRIYITVMDTYLYLFRIASLDEMARTGMYISDLGMYDSSQEMVLSGIQPLPQLEYARDQVCLSIES